MKIVNALRNALGSARKDIENMRDEIADLKAKRAAIDAAPVDLVEAERRLDHETQRILQTTMPTVGKGPGFGGLVERDRRFYASDFDTVFARSPYAMFCAMFPEQTREFMLRNLPSDGLADAERTKRIKTIDAQIAKLERAEEAALREIEAAMGATMPRRPDADPQVLLAGDDTLPG
jgi:chromosome segregation ATPase